MEVKLRIAVLVPQELQHIITKQNDPMFIACREDGHIIIKPMEEYGIHSPRENNPQKRRKKHKKVEGSKSRNPQLFAINL